MKNLMWRLILALGAGLLVSGQCLELISSGRPTVYATYPQTSTQRKLKQAENAIEKYRLKNGKLPASLADIDFEWADTPRAKRQIFDAWGGSILYQRRGATYRLISLGADGKSGGRGLACDLTSDNPNPPEARMSRLDNLRHPLARGMETAALVCGVLVMIITFLSVKGERLTREKWLGVAIQLVILVVASGFVSIVITMLHVPSGH